MAWNADSGILTQEGGYKKIAANGNGDMQRALGTTSLSEIRMLTGLDGYINPLALWKPTRSLIVNFSDAAARRTAFQAAGCGFASTIGSASLPTYFPASGTGADIPSNPWTYLRPVLGTHPLRANDLAPGVVDGVHVGYYKYAVSPIYVDWPSGIEPWRSTQPYNTFIIRFDASGDVAHWRHNLCIGVDDLFPSSSWYANFRFAVVFRNSRGTIIAVSPQSMAQAKSIQAATINVAYSDIASLIPTVGNTVNVAVCLIQDTGQYSTTDTTILTNYTGAVTSLEIEAGCDRTTLKYIGNGSIVGMTGSATVSVGTKTPTSATGFSCYYPISQVDIAISSVNATEWRNLTDVKLRLSFTCTGAMGTPSGPGAPASYEFTLALAANQSKTYQGVLVQGAAGFDACAYVTSTSDVTLYWTLEAIQGSTTVNLTGGSMPLSR